MLPRKKQFNQAEGFPDIAPFTILVQDHIGWVYSCARRQLGDASLADDAVQAVFMTLWRKRNDLAADGRPIGGWLLRATRYACNDLQKINRRRDHHERRAAAMRSEETKQFNEAEFKTEQFLALDAAMQKLSTVERDILVARFFQNYTAREVSQQWQISEAAAEKRISRAVEKLRGIMARKNISMDSAALVVLLTSSAGPAPGALLGTVLRGISGKAPISPAAAHAARNVALHTARIPAIASATAVVLAVGIGAIVPAALTARHPLQKASLAAQVVADDAPAAGKGILTCVAYQMLVQRDFARVIKTGENLLPGKVGGVQAYGISARAMRVLAKTMMDRRRALLGNELHWMATLSQVNRAIPTMPIYFFQNYLSNSLRFASNISLRILTHIRTYAHFARVRINFLPGSQMSASFGPKPTNIHIACAYQGSFDISPGTTAVLLRHLCDDGGTQWYSALIFDVERYPYHEIPTLSTINSIGRYIRVGPKGLRQISEVAAAWQRYTDGHPTKLPPADGLWTKPLPGGAVVTLAAISSGAWPLCQWSPAGVPLGTAPQLIPRGKVNVQFSIRASAWPVQTFTGRSIPGPWRGVVQGNGGPDDATCTVGLDSGKWKIIGTAKPAPVPRMGVAFSVPRDFSFMNHRFGVYFSDAPAANRAYIALFSAARAPNMSRHALAVGAINREGKFVPPTPGNLPDVQYLVRFRTSPSTAIREYSSETIPISPSKVKRYVWITRRRHWIKFRGFALQPSPLPRTVYAVEKRQSTITGKGVITASPPIGIAANQMTPVGLMLLVGQAMRSGNPTDLERLFYAPTPADRHLLAMEVNRWTAQNAYGLWAAAQKQFGVAQMRRAGLAGFIGNRFTPVFPAHWNIKGAYATPMRPLPPGANWPKKGRPLHALVRKNGRWYMDFEMTNAQIINFGKILAHGEANISPQTHACRTVMQQLQAGKIRDAYALRDALNAALKQYYKAAE